LIRQIARLSKTVPALSDRAIAIAVYADAKGSLVTAQEAGYEGVACVDDATRGFNLFCAIWRSTGLAWAKQLCDGLLDFILAMQRDDGQWFNFIKDWDGSINRETRTSLAGGHFWQARAMFALAHARTLFDDQRLEDALRRGAAVLLEVPAPSDVRALHVLTAIELQNRDDSWTPHIVKWCNEIIECNDRGMLMNSPDERDTPHLWGHLQEFALAKASVVLDDQGMLAVAERSALMIFGDVITSGFDRPHTSPYDVSSSVTTMSGVAGVTKDPNCEKLATLARHWFHGRNPASTPVYDVSLGLVADGIDNGHISKNSGAESNIEGGIALLDETIERSRSLEFTALLPWNVT
jgi:hypothetical protein